MASQFGTSPLTRRAAASKNADAAAIYEKLRPLGKGSFGKVFLCRDSRNSALIVAKEIAIRSKSEHEEAAAEAKMLANVSHVNIIRFHDVRRSSPQCVVIYMEYADDGDLEEKIMRRKPKRLYFQSGAICQYLVQVCQALHYLHSRGYIHRDVKVANMFLTKEGFVKLGDFGICKSLDRNAPLIGARTAVTPVGTPMYIAPQVCEGKPYTQKADVWSLGCCLYEMCTLKPAFNAKSMELLMDKIKHARYDRHLPDHFPDDIHDLVPLMLAKNPDRRPTIKEILASKLLQAWLPTSPATLAAQGLDPTPYPPVIDPVDLASKSTPNILRVHTHDKQPLVISAHDRAPVAKRSGAAGLSRTPQPRRKNSPSLSPRLVGKGGNRHRRNHSDGGDGVSHYVSLLQRPPHIAKSASSPVSSPRTTPKSKHREVLVCKEPRHHGTPPSPRIGAVRSHDHTLAVPGVIPREDPVVTRTRAQGHTRSHSDGLNRSQEYWNNPPNVKSRLRYAENSSRSAASTPVGSPILPRARVHVPASNSLADITRFYSEHSAIPSPLSREPTPQPRYSPSPTRAASTSPSDGVKSPLRRSPLH